VQNPGQNDAVIYISLYRNEDNVSAGSFAAGQTRNYSLRKNTFSSCISPVPDICYVILEYDGIVSVPVALQGYTASFQRCCRINGIINIVGPTNSIGNTYTIQLPGSSSSMQDLDNSSPQFVEKDTAVVCFNSRFTLDYSAVDPDMDSLTYEFAPALSGASTNNPAPVQATSPPYSSLPYLPGFAPDNPFGTGEININRRTGLITGTTGNNTGEYVLAVLVREFRNGREIARARKELHVNVANCSAPAAELPIETINCDGLDVIFQNNSISSAITSYLWDFGVAGAVNDTSTQPRPTFIYPDTGVYIAKLIVNREQACSDSATTVIRVFPGFAPGFIADGSCYSNPFQFRDTTSARYGAVNSWRWDFGDQANTSDTSRIRNPSYTYPIRGNYTITFRATSTKGCDKQITVPLVVLDSPRLVLPFKDTLICSIDSLQLRAQGTGNFTWTPGTGRIFNSNTTTPTVYPLTTTTYLVTLNDRGCIARDTVRVNVLDFITVDAGRDTVICRGDPFTLQPVTEGLSFLWSPAAILDNDSIKNPIALPPDSITVIRVTANLGKCQDNDSMVVRTVPYPLAFVGADTAICFGDIAQLTGFGNGNRVEWVPSQTVVQPDQYITSARPLNTTNYILRVYKNDGCPKPGTDTMLVRVIPQIISNAGRDTTLVYGQSFTMNATTNATLFSWVPAFGLSDPTVKNPLMTINRGTIPGDPPNILYTFTTTTPEGCSAEDELMITVFSTGPSIFVPNAFTPNGDRLNDLMRPILAGMRQFDFFRVYNRYGQIIFESKNQENGWDGTINGKPQGSSTFVYQAQAVDFNGNIVRQNGTFILIR
jgi:gliding motility-associated-like protein